MANPARPRFSFRLLLAILAAVAAVLLAAHRGSRALRHENQTSHIRLEISGLSERVNRMVAMRFNAVRAMAADPCVIDLLDGRTEVDNPRVRLVLNTANRVARSELVFVMDSKGTVRSSSDYKGGTLAGINYGFRPYFKGAMMGREEVFPALGAVTLTRGLYLSAPVYGPDKGAPVGVAALKIGIGEIDKALESAPGLNALVSPDGVIFSSSRKAWLFKTMRPISREAVRRFADTRQFGNRTLEPLDVSVSRGMAELDGRECHATEEPLAIPGWSLATFRPANPDYPLTSRQRALLAGALLVTIGLILLVAVLVDNIQGRKRTERALRLSEEEHRSIFENAIEGIFRTARDGRLISANTSLARILGYASSKDMTANVQNIDTQIFNNPAKYAQLTRALLSTGEAASIECRLKSKSGVPIWCLVSAKAVKDLQGRISFFQGFVLDVTDRKRALMELERVNLNLEQLVRERTADLMTAYKELESFSYSVSHDLRAPLRTLDGFSQALMEDYGNRLDEAGMDYLNRVRLASRRMGELIDDLQHLARVSSVDMERKPFDIGAMAEDILADLAAEEPERRVETRIRNGLCAVGDPDMVRLLLSNLLRNAWKFTSRTPDARIEFTAENTSPPTFHVTDNGAGFDMTYAHKLFEAFNRLHSPEEFEGSGIGLSIVQRVIQRHGGNVWAKGRVGRGATFSFTLGASSAGADGSKA